MPITANSQEMPIRLVGSSVFGRYPTISSERTYNMFVSSSGDGEKEWLVSFAGYKEKLALAGGEGRGLFHSIRGDFMIAVVGSFVYRIQLSGGSLVPILVNGGTPLSTSTGEVFIDENLSKQICIVDSTVGKAYIYNYFNAVPVFGLAAWIGVPGASWEQPNYVTFQNTYFIFGNALTDSNGSAWYIFGPSGDPSLNPFDLIYQQELAIQTKPDFAKLALRIPGKGNTLLVQGTSVSEIWTNVGGLQFYQRNSSVNIDYGTISVSTIAANDEVVAWLGVNEKSSPSIMAMTGGGAQRISTDGIDYLLDEVNFPADSTAFLYRQDGHLFYVLSFFNEADDFTIAFDFTTKKFYDLTDWNFTAFPARQLAFFNGQTYFVSFKDGSIYEMGSDLTTYDESISDDNFKVIPRLRVANTVRPERPEKFRVNLFTFVIESGTTSTALTDATRPIVDVSISKNGGITWSSELRYFLKKQGQYRNQPRFTQLGYCEQFTPRLRFWGDGRYVVKNGVIEVAVE